MASSLIGSYDIDRAHYLLGPPDFGDAAPQGCCDYLLLIINNIITSIFRVFNWICGDHQWYNNQTARDIVEIYLDSPSRDPLLDEKVGRLYTALLSRGLGEASYAEGVDIRRILAERPSPSGSEIFMIEDQSGEELALEDERSCDLEIIINTLRAIANRITDAGSRNWALTEIAKFQVLKSLPQGLMTLERMDDDSKALSQMEIVKCISSRLLEEAEELVSQMTLGHHRKAALLEIRKEQIKQDPEMVLGMISEWEKDQDKATILCEVINEVYKPAWDINDCFIGIIESIDAMSSYRQKAVVYCRLAMSHVHLDHDLSNNFFEKVVDNLSYIRNGFLKTSLFLQMSQATNSWESRTYLTCAIETVNNMPDCAVRARARCEIAKCIARVNPAESILYFQSAVNFAINEEDINLLGLLFKTYGGSNPSGAGNIAMNLTNFSYKSRAYVEIANAESKTAPERSVEYLQKALAAADEIEDEITKQKAYYEILKVFVTINLDEAIAIFNDLNQEPYRSQGLYEIVKAQAKVSIEQAIANASLISLRCYKVAAFCEILKA